MHLAGYIDWWSGILYKQKHLQTKFFIPKSMRNPSETWSMVIFMVFSMSTVNLLHVLGVIVGFSVSWTYSEHIYPAKLHDSGHLCQVVAAEIPMSFKMSVINPQLGRQMMILEIEYFCDLFGVFGGSRQTHLPVFRHLSKCGRTYVRRCVSKDVWQSLNDKCVFYGGDPMKQVVEFVGNWATVISRQSECSCANQRPAALCK